MIPICYWDPIWGVYIQTWLPFYSAVIGGWAHTPQRDSQP